jgi:hypothetical protein
MFLVARMGFRQLLRTHTHNSDVEHAGAKCMRRHDDRAAQKVIAAMNNSKTLCNHTCWKQLHPTDQVHS